jgi:hypothetical protein
MTRHPFPSEPRAVNCGRAFSPSPRIFSPLDKSFDVKDVNDGKPWSDADDKLIRMSVAASVGLLEIASSLRRSGDPFAIYRRARELGLGWQPRGKRRGAVATFGFSTGSIS